MGYESVDVSRNAGADLARVCVHVSLERRLRPEVEQQPHLDVRRPQVVDNLGLVRRLNCAMCFEFDEHDLVDDEIVAELRDQPAAKVHWQSGVILDQQAAPRSTSIIGLR